MNKESVVTGYLMNSPQVVAGMLYDTIEKYEEKLKQLRLEYDMLLIDYNHLEYQIKDECELIKTNKEHFEFLKQNERNFISNRLKERFRI